MVKVIPIVIGARGSIPEGLVRELEELEIRRRTVTIPITALLRSVEILRRVGRTPVKDHPTNAGAKKS